MADPVHGERYYRSLSMRAFRAWALRRFPFCQWCRAPLAAGTATADHLTPVSADGSDRLDNLALSCAGCNHRRGNRPVVGRPPHGPACWQAEWDREHPPAARKKRPAGPYRLWAWPARGRDWCPVYTGRDQPACEARLAEVRKEESLPGARFLILPLAVVRPTGGPPKGWRLWGRRPGGAWVLLRESRRRGKCRWWSRVLERETTPGSEFAVLPVGAAPPPPCPGGAAPVR